MEYAKILTYLKGMIAEKYGPIQEVRVKGEIFNNDMFGNFSCAYELLIEGELYTLSLWGVLDSYIYSISKLLECESVDNRPSEVCENLAGVVAGTGVGRLIVGKLHEIGGAGGSYTFSK